MTRETFLAMDLFMGLSPFELLLKSAAKRKALQLIQISALMAGLLIVIFRDFFLRFIH